jgi:hypothetical protein
MRGHADVAYRNYASRLPEVYSGHPNRIERYNQYENMDSDSEINACLDILAEFCTQATAEDSLPFQVKYTDKPTDHEIDIIKKQLKQWVKLINEFLECSVTHSSTVIKCLFAIQKHLKCTGLT